MPYPIYIMLNDVYYKKKNKTQQLPEKIVLDMKDFKLEHFMKLFDPSHLKQTSVGPKNTCQDKS